MLHYECVHTICKLCTHNFCTCASYTPVCTKVVIWNQMKLMTNVLSYKEDCSNQNVLYLYGNRQHPVQIRSLTQQYCQVCTPMHIPIFCSLSGQSFFLLSVSVSQKKKRVVLSGCPYYESAVNP